MKLHNLVDRPSPSLVFILEPQVTEVLIGPRGRLGSDTRNHTLLYRLIFSNKDQNSQSCCDEGDWMTCFLKPCSLKCSGWFKYMSVRFCIYGHVTILHIQVTSLQQMFWWTGLKTMTYITWLCITGLMSFKHRYTKRPGRPKKKKKKIRIVKQPFSQSVNQLGSVKRIDQSANQ